MAILRQLIDSARKGLPNGETSSRMMRVDLRHRGIQIAGFLSVVSGCAFALLLIRVFAVGHVASAWMLLGDLLLVALAAYLIYIGRRAIFYGKGKPLPAARFGWGRMLLGAGLIFSAANTYFHLFPTRPLPKALEYDNATQAAAGNVTTIAICLGCVFLILSGIWRGFRQQASSQDSQNPGQ
jgi:hypothetical protein